MEIDKKIQTGMNRYEQVRPHGMRSRSQLARIVHFFDRLLHRGSATIADFWLPLSRFDPMLPKLAEMKQDSILRSVNRKLLDRLIQTSFLTPLTPKSTIF